MLPIGKKALDTYRRTGLIDHALPADLAKLYDGLNFDKVAPVAELIMDKFADGSLRPHRAVLQQVQERRRADRHGGAVPADRSPPLRTGEG